MISLVKAKSEEWKIPYANALAGYITELFLELFAKEPYRQTFLLREESSVGIVAYQRRPVLSLEYSYVGEHDFAEIVGMLKKDIEMCLKSNDITLKYEKYTEKDNLETIELQIQAEESYVPYTIVLQKETLFGLYPDEVQLRLCFANERSIALAMYPFEQEVARDAATMLQGLELLQDVSPYLRSYRRITTRALEGRKVEDALAHFLTEENVEIEKAAALWETYGNNPYLKKRWKAYLRQQKLTEPSWEEAFALLATFLLPIFSALQKGEIFFEDWMPELRRYLD